MLRPGTERHVRLRAHVFGLRGQAQRDPALAGASTGGERRNLRRLPPLLPLLGERAGVRETGATARQSGPGLAKAALATPAAGNGDPFPAEDFSDLGFRIYFGTRNSNFGFQVMPRHLVFYQWVRALAECQLVPPKRKIRGLEIGI